MTEQIACPECDETVERQQRRRRAGDGIVVPLPLGFHAKMRARFGEGDLDLPAPNEVGDDLSGLKVDVSAHESLGFTTA